MDRRSFLQSAAATGLVVGLGRGTANASTLEHNWDRYDWGSGLPVPDRLYQGPFPQYGPSAVVPESDVSMITSPSRDIVSNYGMGLMVYASDDTGPLHVPGQTTERTLEDLIKLPFAQKIYIRPNWRDVQKQPGRLDFPGGGKLRSIWHDVTTSALVFASCWRIPTLPIRVCQIFSLIRCPT
jgi:hypothetical protein